MLTNDTFLEGDGMGDTTYVHGYSEREAQRMADQAGTLSDLLHQDTAYPAGSRVLEAGCGTGCQTVFLARNSPDADIHSVDISADSLDLAKARIRGEGVSNVTFHQGSLFELIFEPESFDHVFVCFVLEHLSEPERALVCLKNMLKPGGSLTVIEGDHGSFTCHPETPEAMETVRCLIRVQAEMGGDANIGRRLYPLLSGAGLRNVTVSPRFVYADDSRPDWVEGFSKNTFTAMVEGVREQTLAAGMMSEANWEKGISDLYRATEEDGVFCYTFFKGVGTK